MLVLRLAVWLLCIAIVHGTSLVPPSSTLRPSDQQFWQSSNTDFKFGFHPTGSDGLFVVGIGFKDTSLVWTAAADGSGGFTVNDEASFHFQADGNLVLLDGTKTVLWQSNTGNKGATSATMHDNGNFVLQTKSNATVWDTFGNPTDTLLIGQVLGSGKTLRLNSYSFALQLNGNLTLKWNDTIIYWNAGQSKSNATASLDNHGGFTLSNSSGGRLWTALSNDYKDSRITMRRIKLDPDGNLRSYGWEDGAGSWRLGWTAVEDQCQVYGLCGNFGMCVYNDRAPICRCPTADFVAVDSNDPTKGCKREQDIAACANNQSMVELQNTQFLSYPPESLSDKFYSGVSDCKQNCLQNAVCIASTVMSDGSGTCHIKVASFVSVYQSPILQSVSYIKVCGSGRLLLRGPPTRDVPSTKTSVVRIAIAVMGTAMALLFVETWFWWVCCRKNSRFRRLSAECTLLEYASGVSVQFSYKELQKATRGFRESMGSGRSGVVYKGTLPDRSVVAVKRLEGGVDQGDREFRMKAALIGSTHHLNLARLVGFCSEGRHRLLVYEFINNTSLDTFLFGPEEHAGMLNWETRFKIALGTARGIAYLHEECRECIVHGAIKPQNILLDNNFNVKVSDFGLINGRDWRNHRLSSVQSIRGYLAPEWPANLPITSKSDVFSYGMVLLEIISGRRNFEAPGSSGRRGFPTWAYGEFERGNIENIVDDKLGLHINVEEVERAMLVCFWCIQEQPSQRPSMGQVVQMLEGLSQIEKPPFPTPVGRFQSSLSTSSNTISGLGHSVLQ